jgi:hypothetical protein
VRRALRVVVLIVVLAACAGVGAFVASRSNPFPPGVTDPGARPTEPTEQPEPPVVRWVGTSVVRTTHRLFVGGSCRTDWRVRVLVRQDGNRLEGRATARLVGRVRCDFPTAQLQTRSLLLQAEGRIRGPAMRLTFAEEGRAPGGSMDLGALLPLLDRIRADLDMVGDLATGKVDLAVPDGERGSYTVRGELRLSRRA